METGTRVLEMALEAGFDAAGLTPLAPPPAQQHFRRWLAAGHHAGMDWLERQAPRILDPARLLEGGKSLLMVVEGHAREAVELPGGGRVARYAAGRDYHNAMGKRLRKLGRLLEQERLVGTWRKAVDAVPLLERSHAAAAGLGFESKAANLLRPDFGPWFFLGELLLDVELEPTTEALAGSCGSCRACLDACPTGALLEAGVLDARLCLSFHTIENRGPVPEELEARTGDWFFGCDVCSEVCPWGGAQDHSERLGTHPAVAGSSLLDFLRMDQERFDVEVLGTPLRRAHRDGLARNAAIVLGNRPTEEGRDGLLESLVRESAPLVRGAAASSLGRAHGEDHGVAAALEAAAAREPDSDARARMRRALDGARRASPSDD